MELRKIVVGIDFSAGSEVAVRRAVDIARHSGAELVLVHAGPPAAAEQLQGSTQGIAGDGVDFSTIVVEGHADAVLVDKARELSAELIAVGSVGLTGLQRFLLGSVASRVIRTAEASVLVAREPGNSQGGFHRILVPTDFSEHAEAALQMAAVLAAPGAAIDLIHCWQMPLASTTYIEPMPAVEAAMGSAREEIVASARRRGADLLTRHRREGLELRFEVIEGNPAHTIIDRAADGYDVVVVGSHGRRGFRRWILGSVAERTVHHVPGSVLVVHRPH
jgi:nucleotide-binding universal stress UspA family protein